MMALYEKLDVVWYAVTDWQRAKSFYREALGLQPTFGADEMGWQQYAVGEGSPDIAISRAQPGQKVTGDGGAVVVLAVIDIEAGRQRLLAKNVRCDEVTVIPNTVKLCTFYDPDGNRLQLAQPLMG